MTPVFFRQNKKQPNEILDLFPLSDQGLDAFSKPEKICIYTVTNY
jgi:hypothetical protein